MKFSFSLFSLPSCILSLSSICRDWGFIVHLVDFIFLAHYYHTMRTLILNQRTSYNSISQYVTFYSILYSCLFANWIKMRREEEEWVEWLQKKTKFLILTYFIEIEWEIARHRAIETRFHKWCPTVPESMWATFVPFAYTSHTWKHRLELTHKEHEVK